MKKKQKKSIIHELIEWTLYLFSAVIVASILHSQVFAMTIVNQQSMENTLIEGQKLVMEKISYEFHEPRCGDIVVFLNNETKGLTNTEGFINKLIIYVNDISLKLKGENRNDRLIKRVIAVAGDEITIKDGYVYVNGEKLDEPYTKTITPDQNISEIIPEGYVYVMGDNRSNSKDSRSFGSVEIKQIEGKIIYRLSPINKIGKP